MKADLKHVGLLSVFLVRVQYLYCQQSCTYSLCLDQFNLSPQLEVGYFCDDMF